MQCYQERVSRAFNKKVRPVTYKPSDLVLKWIIPNVKDPRRKFSPNYDGPYVVKQAFSGGALILIKMERVVLPYPINVDSLRRYYT
ncbi:hypothetical protein MLD38_025636 [Melastoma candidum]|uniref:Uncharacterized protein n=1 Tax=Melastoma candidum TaxID=119954 RepID=A0ACB9P2X1_9MYRT|nr:hypothetical protein MLD38_025636 [Melastoma candidum]